MSNEVISALIGAFVGALLTGGFAWWLHKIEQDRNKREELRNMTMQLVDIRDKINNEIFNIQDISKRENASIAINNKRQIYLEAAMNIVEEIPNQVESSEYIFLAYELMLDANFKKVEEFFKRAIRNSRSIIAKSTALRAAGVFYFSQSTHRNFDLGRKYFKQSVELFSNPSDPYSLYLLGYNYENWGLYELANGFELEGKAKIDNARKYYRDMPNNYPLKSSSLEGLDRKMQQAMSADSTYPNAQKLQ
ncbi:MAG: hypothetical protein ACK40V_03605 [Anaerolineales bacterium]